MRKLFFCVCFFLGGGGGGKCGSFWEALSKSTLHVFLFCAVNGRTPATSRSINNTHLMAASSARFQLDSAVGTVSQKSLTLRSCGASYD